MSFYISSLGYALGEKFKIDDLANNDQLTAMLKASGLNKYCRASSGLEPLWRTSLAKTIRATVPTEIDLVIFANSNTYWDASLEQSLLRQISAIGVEAKDVVGISSLGCAAFPAILDLAIAIVQQRKYRTALVVIFGKSSQGDRIDHNLRTVLSDGVATFLVSNEKGVQIVGVKTSRIQKSADAAKSTSMQRWFDTISQLVDATIVAAGLQNNQIDFIIGSNINLVTQTFVRGAVGNEKARLFSSSLAELGHVQGCDGAIELTHLVAENIAPNKFVLVCGWGNDIISAAVLKITTE